MSLTISEYLSKKGAVGLLCEIDPYGSRFNELLEELEIGSPTLTKRLSEAIELSLIEKESLQEVGTTHQYILSGNGAALRMVMEELGVVITYNQLKSFRQQFELKRGEVQEYVSDNPGQFEDAEENATALSRLRKIPRYSNEN